MNYVNFIIPSKENNYYPKVLRGNSLLFLVVFLLVLKIGLIAVTISFPQNIFFADITRSALENFVNQTRESLGLNQLTDSAKLDQAARLKAEDMIKDQYFSHTSPTGISPWYWFKQAGYTYKYAGENLAVGFFESEEVFNAWLNSAGHRANIVNPNYTEIGTAVLDGFGQNGATIVVQEFGSPKNVNVSANVNNPVSTPSAPSVASPINKPIQTVEATPTPPLLSPEPEQRVLSQSISPQISGATTGRDSFFLRALNFVVYDYYALLQGVIYGISLLIAGMLIMLISFNPKRELVLRTGVIILILTAASFLDRGIILSLIPHGVII